MNLPLETDHRTHHDARRSSVVHHAGNGRRHVNLIKMHKYAKLFEKKVFNCRAKKFSKSLWPDNHCQEDEESALACTDSGQAAHRPFGSIVPSTLSSRSAADISNPACDTTGSTLSAYCTPGQDTNPDSSSGGTVITFSFLSNLEAHIEYCGNIICVSWVAATQTSYQFVKNNLSRFRLFLRHRLMKKISAGAQYKKKIGQSTLSD